MERSEIEDIIARQMPVEEFLRIQTKLAELRGEEEQKLKALAQLQQYFVTARSDEERESVRVAVAEIRELSRESREKIRTLNSQLARHMTIEEARNLYEQWQRSQGN